MSINYLNRELEGGKFQAEECIANAENSRQCGRGTKRSLMWLEKKVYGGHKRRLQR